MDMATRLSNTECEYVFGPLPETAEAKDWLMELDFVDVLEGSIEELEALASRAPTREIRLWLEGFIHMRKMLRGFAAWPPQPQPPVPAEQPVDQRSSALSAPIPRPKKKKKTPQP